MTGGNSGEEESTRLLGDREHERSTTAKPTDGATRILTERQADAPSGADVPESAGGAADDATRVLEPKEKATVVINRPAMDTGAAATRVLTSGVPAQAGTDVSMPPAQPPVPASGTSVSVPVAPIVQVSAPRTGASASPSSAKTAGSAVDRDSLPQQGDFIKERFELIQELGRGGMGAVFRARDMRKMEALDPDPFVAIKFIAGNLVGFERAFVALQREAKNAQELNHPNIVKVFDFDRDQNLVYLTMEVVDGVALHSRMREAQTRPFTPAERNHLTHGMLSGMSYAHSRELAHADLKPSNMMVTTAGELKILDFGIARRREYDTVFDADDLFALTIDYASPEMLGRQRPTPSDDVYALGCIIYAMHAGAHPFNHVRADVARNDKMRPVKPPGITRVQWQALRKALAFSREERFADAGEFQRAYEAPDWRRIGGLAAGALAILIGLAWWAADPIQSKLTLWNLDPEQSAQLQQSLGQGAEYLAGGYAEDAIFAYAEALGIDTHNGDARKGIRAAFSVMRAKLKPADYRAFLEAQVSDERNPAWVKDLAAKDLSGLESD